MSYVFATAALAALSDEPIPTTSEAAAENTSGCASRRLSAQRLIVLAV